MERKNILVKGICVIGKNVSRMKMEKREVEQEKGKIFFFFHIGKLALEIKDRKDKEL